MNLCVCVCVCVYRCANFTQRMQCVCESVCVCVYVCLIVSMHYTHTHTHTHTGARISRSDSRHTRVPGHTVARLSAYHPLPSFQGLFFFILSLNFRRITLFRRSKVFFFSNCRSTFGVSPSSVVPKFFSFFFHTVARLSAYHPLPSFQSFSRSLPPAPGGARAPPPPQ